MGKGSNKVNLPPTPTYQEEPLYRQGFTNLADYANRLINFNLTGGLAPLQDTISLDPKSTELALAAASGFLSPEFDRTIQQIKNEAAANNQLESSTFTDALSRAAENLNSQFQGITAQAALDDRSRALSNRLSLLGTGLNTLQSATAFAGDSESKVNQFNLENYQNQVAKALAEAKQSKGGLFGGLTGAAGGAALGIALAPFTGGLSLGLTGALAAGGGALGALGPQGTGGQLLNAGAGLAGSGLSGGLFNQMPISTPTSMPSSFPGSYASNGLTGYYGSNNNLYDKLLSSGGIFN